MTLTEKLLPINPGKKTIPENSVSISLDHFDDLFSDFDSRPFSERNISDDFINELKKRITENDYSITEIRFLLPESERKTEFETLITKRLHQFFKSELTRHEKNLSIIRSNGFFFLLLGMALMLIAAYSSALVTKNWIRNVLFTLSEPSGWYFAWNGLEKIFSKTGKNLPELNLFRKINKAKINFTSYTSSTI